MGVFTHARPLNSLRENGGAEEDRTPDLRIANATLSQLSYGPTRPGHNTFAAGCSLAQSPSGDQRPHTVLAMAAPGSRGMVRRLNCVEQYP